MTAIDFRLRPPTTEFSVYHQKAGTAWFNQRIGCVVAPSFLQDSMDLLLEEMREARIDVGVVIGRNIPTAYISNDHIAALQRKHPRRLIGFGGLDPCNIAHNALQELERCVTDLGLKGVAIDPGLAAGGNPNTNAHGLYPNDRRLYPLYERCAARRIPIEIMSGPYCGRDLSYTDPVRFDEVAGDFPDLTLILGHGCWPYASEIVAVGLRRTNVYISPDIYFFAPGAEPFVQAANSYLAEQMLFATAYPARPLGRTMDDFLALPISDEAKEKILYRNAARILGLTPSSSAS